jgi:hypothetical protein
MTTTQDSTVRPNDDPDSPWYSADINWSLLQSLHDKPHPLLHIADDFEKQIREIPIAWTGEVFTAARTAHHLLDMIGIPQGKAYASDLDARTFRAVLLVQRLKERLDRLTSWHSRETADGGMVGDYCNECGHLWPCDTRKMAEGIWTEADEMDGGDSD